jgi:DHA2 family multidrug resistance protein
MLTVSLIWMAHLNLGLSYPQLVFMRMFQASGLAFLFIPINTIAYVGVKQSESNDVSGLTNLARNIGGSCGTAFLATMLIRRTATHESNMVRNLTPGNPGFNSRIDSMKGMFGHGASAIHSAQASIYNMLHRQAATLAYIDIIQYMTIFCACMIPLLVFIPRPSKNAAASAGH